jgi:crotonobetainyl-CoA:carnitine CoA-transferase CaiB-like acyl-CoA transferase
VQYQNGPTATMMMSDFGADVVKIERPEGGDPGRGGHMADGFHSCEFGLAPWESVRE